MLPGSGKFSLTLGTLSCGYYEFLSKKFEKLNAKLIISKALENSYETSAECCRKNTTHLRSTFFS